MYEIYPLCQALLVTLNCDTMIVVIARQAASGVGTQVVSNLGCDPVYVP